MDMLDFSYVSMKRWLKNWIHSYRFQLGIHEIFSTCFFFFFLQCNAEYFYSLLIFLVQLINFQFKTVFFFINYFKCSKKWNRNYFDAIHHCWMWRWEIVQQNIRSLNPKQNKNWVKITKSDKNVTCVIMCRNFGRKRWNSEQAKMTKKYTKQQHTIALRERMFPLTFLEIFRICQQIEIE